MTISVSAAFCVVSSAIASPSDTKFECPDDRALQLLSLAVNPLDSEQGFKNSISAYSFVIESSTRAMDEVALKTACRGLARDSYWDEHFDPGSDVFGQMIPPREAVGPLRKKHPILSKCPDYSLYESQLPIRIPAAYVPPKDAVQLGVTGWVDLELDVSDDGKVESARIVDSSDSILESGVIDYVLQFRYPKSSHYNGQTMRRKGFQVRIATDYFHIARANGCEWVDPRSQLRVIAVAPVATRKSNRAIGGWSVGIALELRDVTKNKPGTFLLNLV